MKLICGLLGHGWQPLPYAGDRYLPGIVCLRCGRLEYVCREDLPPAKVRQ